MIADPVGDRQDAATSACWPRPISTRPSRARSTCDGRRGQRARSPTSRSLDEQARRRRRAGAALQHRACSPTAPRAGRRPSGIGVAMIGSLYMMVIVLLLALPIGVAASIYLEEFAPKNRLTDLIEVNINNLAAVPSIVFGLLGLAVFINFLGLPRSASLVGGLVLTLMTLPTIIIATRAALAAVPPSIRAAALGARRLEDADGVPPRAAAGDARHPDRHHHRPGARARRNRAAAADRHGGLRRRLSDDAARSGDGAAGADLHVGQRAGARLRRAHVGRHHHPARLPHGHEHHRRSSCAGGSSGAGSWSSCDERDDRECTSKTRWLAR